MRASSSHLSLARLLVLGGGLLVTVFLVGCSSSKKEDESLPTERFVVNPDAKARSHNIDQKRMVVDVEFEPHKRLVRGTVTHYFEPLRQTIDSLFLDGPGIRYEEVRLNGAPVSHRVTDEGIWVRPASPRPWDQTDTLSIRYEATPRHALYFAGWTDSTKRAPRQIWTQGQGPGHRHWVPLYDAPNDKLVTETRITFDDEYQVLSNGKRLAVTQNDDGTRTWHYRMTGQHPGYVMMLGIGRYDIQRMTSSSGVEIYNYYYPDQPERAGPTYRYTDRMIDIMERETGVEYPWSRYSQIPVHNFLHGGMENTTATVFSDAYYVDERAYRDQNYVTVNAHEIAHQWFGDLVTMGRDREIWLHESFATHYAKIIERVLFGEEHYQWNRKKERDRVLQTLDRGPVPIRYKGAGAGLVYYKGSLVLDMLKDVVGKAEFDRVIETYLRRHAHGNVTSEHFFHLFDEVLGRNLDWFFEQWILRGGVPHYQVSHQTADSSGTTYTDVLVRQVHETGPLVKHFRMPIAVEVHYEDGRHVRTREWVDGAETTLRLSRKGDRAVDYVLFDPGNRVLKKQTFERSLDERASQFRKASNMIDRYDALVALREAAVADKRAALSDAYGTEPSPHVRAEIVKQLAEDPKSTDVLEAALRDPSSTVRGTALRQVSPITDPLVDGFERALTDSSYQNVETALDRLAKARPEQAQSYLERTAGVEGHDHNVRITWLSIQARLGETGMPSELIDYAGPAYSFRTRVSALRALQDLDVANERLAAHLLDAVSHFSWDLRGPATSVMKKWLKDESKRALLEEAYRAQDWTERQAARIERRLTTAS